MATKPVRLKRAHVLNRLGQEGGEFQDSDDIPSLSGVLPHLRNDAHKEAVAWVVQGQGDAGTVEAVCPWVGSNSDIISNCQTKVSIEATADLPSLVEAIDVDKCGPDADAAAIGSATKHLNALKTALEKCRGVIHASGLPS